jgi:hypothetical protein
VAEKIKKALTWIICKTLPTCKNITELASRSLETELSRREKLMMKLHLWSCVACHRYLSQLKFMRKAFELQENKLKQKPVPVLSSNAVDRLKDKIRSSQFVLIFVLINCL